MESTLIYNELWKDICIGDVKPNKLVDVNSLAKCEIKDEKDLAWQITILFSPQWGKI